MSIFENITKLKKSDMYPFHMPGHKRRMMPVSEYRELYETDITEIDDFDDLHDAHGIIAEAEAKAAGLYEARETHFLTNGATGGILAAIYAMAGPKDTIYMARNCHKSVYNGVMLSGADVKYIYPEIEGCLGINAGISAKQIEEAIKSDGNEGRKLVIITSPTYEGVVSDIENIAAICHRYGCSLLVDAAHGAHFGFYDGFPNSPIKQGADVVITSVHKTLPAPTQTALIHISDLCPDKECIRESLKIFLSSSPSYVLMSAIEGCIDYLSENRDRLFKEYSVRLDNFYKQTEVYSNIGVLNRDLLVREGSFDYDRGRIVIYDKSLQLSGRQLYDILREKYRLQPEMAAGSYVVLITTVADDEEGFTRLANALKEIDESLESKVIHNDLQRSFVQKVYDRFIGNRVKNLLFSGDNILKCDDIIDIEPVTAVKRVSSGHVFRVRDREYIPVELSEGRTNAGYVMCYPPGIPLAVPGEVLSGEVVDSILSAIENNLNVVGINDNKEIEVIWEKSST